jgi:hypothetical protein
MSFWKKRLAQNIAENNQEGILVNKRCIKVCEMELAGSPKAEIDAFINKGTL